MVRFTNYHEWGVPESGDEDYEDTFDTWWNELDGQVIKKGSLSNRPAAGGSGRWYLATDGPTIYYDNGNQWITAGGSNLDSGSLDDVAQITFDTSNSNLTIRDQFDSVQMEFHGGGAIEVPGEIRFGDGSSSSPSITFADDDDVGLYRPGADQLHVVTAATDALQLDASQNVTVPNGDIVDGAGNIVYDQNNNHIPTSRLQSDSITLSGETIPLGDNRAEFDFVKLVNKEWGDVDQDGALYWDQSEGLYIKSSNAANTQTGGRLVWTGANFTAGNGISVSYNSSDNPTLSLTNDSLTVAGNSVSLGGSTSVASTDLSDSGDIAHINESESISSNWNFADDTGLRFGNGDNIEWRWNSTDTRLELIHDPDGASPYDLMRIGDTGIFLPNRDLYMEDRHIRRVESVRFSGDGDHDSIFLGGNTTPFRVFSEETSNVVAWFRHNGELEVPSGDLKVSGGDSILTTSTETSQRAWVGGRDKWSLALQSDDDLEIFYNPENTSDNGFVVHSTGEATYFNKATYQDNLVTHAGVLMRSASSGSNRYGLKYKDGSDDILLTNREAGGDTYIASNTGTAGDEADAIHIPSGSNPNVRVLNGLSVNGEDMSRQARATIPTSEISDGDHAEIRVYVPADMQLNVWMWGARTDGNTTPAGLTVELFDETSGTSVTSSSTPRNTGSPITSVNNGTTSMDATLRLNNNTGGTINASAVFGYTIET